MESGVLNTSGQSNYHSCRASLETMTAVQNGYEGTEETPVAAGDSTFVCNKDTSAILSPSNADVSDLMQSNVIAESTRTSIQMNGSGFGDDSSFEQAPLPQKLTGGISHLKQSTSYDSSDNVDVTTGAGNSGLNDCLINSALGCSASMSMDVDPVVPLRSVQVDQDLMDISANNDQVDPIASDPVADEADDILTDENDGAMRQNRSGSFTIVREKAIPGTPVIEDEPIELIKEEFERNGSTTPPQQGALSPGLMQDSASRPLIPKAKNRKSVWGATDVFSPAALSNMNNGGRALSAEDDLLGGGLASDQAVLLPNSNINPNDPFASPLVQVQTTPNATFSRSTGSKMLVETMAAASMASSCDALSVPLSTSQDTDNNDLSYHSANGGGGSNNGESGQGNRSYVISSGSVEDEPENNNGFTPVVDAGNVSAALNASSNNGRTTSSSLLNNSNQSNRGVTPPSDEADSDGLVAGNGTNIAYMSVGSSATITKAKPTPVRQQSPALSALPPHMISPAVSQPPLPPASSSPKHHVIANGNSGRMSPGLSDTHALCTTPILPVDAVNGPAPTNGNGHYMGDDVDRSELLARISQLELENSMLKSKFKKFEDINNQLVVSCSAFSSGPSPGDLEEFHKFVQARLLAAEEVSDDYRSQEAAFNHLYRKHERAQAIIAEAEARDRQLRSDIQTMKQAVAVGEQRLGSMMHEYAEKLAEMESKNAGLEDNMRTEQLKHELRIGQMEIEMRNLQQQLQQKDAQVADLNRLLCSAMASTTRR